MTKTLNFHIFRYHLLPLSTSMQTEMFEQKVKTIEELKEKKNDFLSEVLDDLNYYKNKKHPLKVEHKENGYYFIKLAQKKSTTIIQNFEDFEVENEPFVYIIINNDKGVQKIAISENKDAFSSPKVVKGILKQIVNVGLKSYGLNIEIEELFKAEDFWKLIGKHKYELQQIDFKYIKPNLANISKSLPEDFRNFADDVNSHESHIVLKAPENGILENIDKKNKNINGLVDYTSEGAGDIKLKIKGFSKKHSTKKNPVIIKIGEATIEGPSEQVIKVYQSIVSE